MTTAYLRPKEAAAYMSVSRARLYRLIADKKLIARQVGGLRLIKISDIETMIDNSPEAQIKPLK
jgi:excisionase family DNA binding protein